MIILEFEANEVRSPTVQLRGKWVSFNDFTADYCLCEARSAEAIIRVETEPSPLRVPSCDNLRKVGKISNSFRVGVRLPVRFEEIRIKTHGNVAKKESSPSCYSELRGSGDNETIFDERLKPRKGF